MLSSPNSPNFLYMQQLLSFMHYKHDIKPTIDNRISTHSPVKFSFVESRKRHDTIILVATGPSRELYDFSAIRSMPVDLMCSNRPPRLLNGDFEFWVLMDWSQHLLHKEWLDNYNGILLSPKKHGCYRDNQFIFKLLGMCACTDKMEFTQEIAERAVRMTGTSTTAMISLSLMLGYDKIIVVGVDMNTSGTLYPWGGCLDGTPSEVRRQRFELENTGFTQFAERLPDEWRDKITFCGSTGWSFQELFKTVSATQEALLSVING